MLRARKVDPPRRRVSWRRRRVGSGGGVVVVVGGGDVGIGEEEEGGGGVEEEEGEGEGELLPDQGIQERRLNAIAWVILCSFLFVSTFVIFVGLLVYFLVCSFVRSSSHYRR